MSAAALAAEAVAAVDGLAARRAEGDRGLLAAGRARGGEHLAGSAIVATTTTAAAVAAGAARIAARSCSRRRSCTSSRRLQLLRAALRLARQEGQRRGSVKPRCE